jgi:hypothetical protein
MPWDWEGTPELTVLTGWESNQEQEKTMWTEGNRSLGKLKWRVYPMPPRGEEKEDFKKGNTSCISKLPVSGSPSHCRNSLLYFHFLFPQ